MLCIQSINAALVMLCDGRKIELFDREEDLVNPIATNCDGKYNPRV